MDDISFNGQHELRKSRSGRILIPRLKTWTGERAIVNKKGTLKIMDGNLDYTSTFQSERSMLNASSSYNYSQISFRKPVLPQTNLTKTFSECDLGKKDKTKLKKDRPQATLSKKRNLRQRILSTKNCNVVSSTVSSSYKVSPSKTEKRKAVLLATKVRTPSPRKNLRKQPSQLPNRKNLRKQQSQSPGEEDEIDLFGPEFQPTVRLVRLLPEEILSLTERKAEKPIRRSPRKTIPVSKYVETTKNQRQKKPEPVVQTHLEDADGNRSRKLSNRRRPRTVRETQQMLSVFNHSKNCEELEDEAVSTAAFFRHSPNCSAMKLLDEAVEILKDDFESDDNLSFRALSERESSPMSSAVSPIGSFHETDGEVSGREEGLLKASPAIRNSSDFQRAKLLHRTLKDKAKLLRKVQSRKREDLTLNSPSRTVNATPNSSQMLKPRVMRALEKELKEKTRFGLGKFDYSAYYRGNLLHVSVNSDSESDDSIADSLDEL